MKKQSISSFLAVFFLISLFAFPMLKSNDTKILENESTLPKKTASNDDWLSVEGNRIVDAQGFPVLLSGINWFGFETSNQGFDGLWDTRLDDALDLITDLGFNLLRIPLCVQLVNEWRTGGTPRLVSVNNYINPELVNILSIDLLDMALEFCSQRGLKVMLDMHRVVSSHMTNLWYYQGYTTEDWIECWRWLAARYAGDDTIIAMDIFNEPHGDVFKEGDLAAKWDGTTDLNNWKYAAEQCAEVIHSENPNVLIMVEGIQSTPKAGSDYTSIDPEDYDSTWWGGNCRAAKDFPVNLGINQNKLVYSPHEYGPSVFVQDWFYPGFNKDTLYTDVWYPNWYYLVEEGTSPLLIGEWGGHIEEDNGIWMTEFSEFMDEQNMHQTFWCFNPNSGDTGGIVENDWHTVETEKYNMIERVLWKDSLGRYVSLDHVINLGASGTNIVDYYANGNPEPVPPGDTPDDTTPPSINQPIDIDYQLGNTGNSISWTVSDANPATYTITRDGVSVDSGSYLSGSVISINVDGLEVNTYTYIITAQDQAGNQASDTVLVIVSDIEDTTPPEISQPADITYNSGDMGISLIWTIIDESPATYTVTRNGAIITTGTHTPPSTIVSINIDGLTAGAHTYVLTVVDQGGYSSSDTAFVTVTSPIGGQVSMGDVSSQQVGNTFTADIFVNTGNQRLAAYGIIINYDPSIVKIVSIVASSTGFLAAANINNTDGTANVAGFEAAGTDPNAALDLLVITWEAVGEGTAIIDIEVDSLADEATNTIGTPVGIDNTIIVTSFALGDVNHDNAVTIVDALLVAQFYVGQAVSIDESLADVNEDGSITIVDALLIAQYYVGTIPTLPPA